MKEGQRALLSILIVGFKVIRDAQSSSNTKGPLSPRVYLGSSPASGLHQRIMGPKNSVSGLIAFLSAQLNLPDALP